MMEVVSAMEVLRFNVGPIYEFAAPKIFDFIRGETDEERRTTEAWFDSASGYASIAWIEEQSLQDSSAYNDQNIHANQGNSDATSVILNCQDPCTYQEDNTVLDMDICTPDLHFRVGKVEGTTKTNHRFGSKSTLTKPTASYLAKKFVSKVPDQYQPNDKLKLTIPKDRTRQPKVKSSAELEEEMLAKIPKFKALPLNKKILEAPISPLPQKTSVQFPIFQEFNLKTMERATHYTGATTSVSSSSVSLQMQNQKVEKNKVKQNTGGVLTEPKMPHLETKVRASPPKLKSTEELEKEELEKAPKFKIFSSRGDMGIPRNVKRKITNPVEFHFATQERCHQPSLPIDLFEKLSLNSDSSQDPACKKTVPKPFHLLTEECGAEKEKKFRTELKHLPKKE